MAIDYVPRRCDKCVAHVLLVHDNVTTRRIGNWNTLGVVQSR